MPYRLITMTSDISAWDYNRDGKVDILDALHIAQVSAGL